MFINLLNIENEKVVPGIECYTIPELKAILDGYEKEEAIEILTYLHFLYHPKSAYKNIPEHERKEVILEKTRTLDWTDDDMIVVNAERIIKEMFLSPTRRFFEDAKYALERLGKYMRTTQISDGKDGNFGTYSMNLTRLGKILDDFKKLEKAVEEEEKTQIRGDQETSDI
jgi:hypothetical protein